MQEPYAHTAMLYFCTWSRNCNLLLAFHKMRLALIRIQCPEVDFLWLGELGSAYSSYLTMSVCLYFHKSIPFLENSWYIYLDLNYCSPMTITWRVKDLIPDKGNIRPSHDVRVVLPLIYNINMSLLFIIKVQHLDS